MPQSQDFRDRAAFISFCRDSAPLMRRDQFILRFLSGKTVLDVGCIDHSVEQALSQGEMWLHRRIVQTAGEVVGLDIDQVSAAFFSGLGFDIRQGDAEDFDLGRKFEVVVAADVLEHLPNPGNFLRCAFEHLAPNGKLILTTPNPMSFEQVVLVAARNSVMVNYDHTAWFTPHTMHTLAQKLDLKIADFTWLYHERGGLHSGGSPARRIAGKVARSMGRTRSMWNSDFGLVLVPT